MLCSLFTDDLLKLSRIAIGAAGAFEFIKSAIDAVNNGTSFDNVKGMILGTTLLVVGLALAFGPVAGAIAGLIAGIAMLVIGIRDWITAGELSTETFWLLEAAIVAVTLAIAALGGGPIALVIGGIAAALAVYKNWGPIKEWFQGQTEEIKGIWDGLIEKLQNAWEELKGWAPSYVLKPRKLMRQLKKSSKTTVIAAAPS